MEGGDDPEDSVPCFQQLLAEIKKVNQYHTNGVANQVDKLIANDVEFVFVKDESGGKIIPKYPEPKTPFQPSQPKTSPASPHIAQGREGSGSEGSGMGGWWSGTGGQRVGGSGGQEKGDQKGGGDKAHYMEVKPHISSQVNTPQFDKTAMICQGKGCNNTPNPGRRWCKECYRVGQRVG